MDLRDILAILLKRRWLIAIVLSGSLSGAAVFNALHRPLYRTSVLLELNAGAAPLTTYSPAFQQQYASPAWLTTQIEVLKGRALAERVVVDRLSPELANELREGPVLPSWRQVLGSALQRVLRREPQLGPAPGAPGAIPYMSAVLQSRLGVEPGATGSQLVTVTVEGFTSAGVAAAANTLAEAYIEQVRVASKEQAGGARGWLSERLDEQYRTLDDSARRLREYERTEGVVNLEERRLQLGQILSVLNTQIAQVEGRVRGLETLREQLTAEPEELANLPAVRNSPAVAGPRADVDRLRGEARRLARDLGERHPRMVQAHADLLDAETRLAEAIQAMAAGSEAELSSSRLELQSLRDRMRSANQEMTDIKAKAVRHDLLKREADATQHLVSGLTMRSKEAGLEGEVTAPAVRILERAQPPGGPFAPNREATYWKALMYALALCAGLVVGLEQFNASVASPEEIRALGLNLLVTIPDISLGKGLTVASSPVAGEAYRVLRTNLQLKLVEAGKRTIIVTSSCSGDGKSTTTAGLAAALARGGARVLLVDGDLRRPNQHRIFETPLSPGLADLLDRSSAETAAVRPTAVPNLSLVTAGHAAENPAELLGTPALGRWLAEQRAHYDWILLDSPPLLAVSDSTILATHADAALVVAAAQRTPRRGFLEALEALRHASTPISGVVLNRVNHRLHSYYYGEYYGNYPRRRAG